MSKIQIALDRIDGQLIQPDGAEILFYFIELGGSKDPVEVYENTILINEGVFLINVQMVFADQKPDWAG